MWLQLHFQPHCTSQPQPGALAPSGRGSRGGTPRGSGARWHRRRIRCRSQSVLALVLTRGRPRQRHRPRDRRRRRTAQERASRISFAAGCGERRALFLPDRSHPPRRRKGHTGEHHGPSGNLVYELGWGNRQPAELVGMAGKGHDQTRDGSAWQDNGEFDKLVTSARLVVLQPRAKGWCQSGGRR
jgi:hypothetical protein